MAQAQISPRATNTPFGGYPAASMLPLTPGSDQLTKEDEPLTSAPLDVESALRASRYAFSSSPPRAFPT